MELTKESRKTVTIRLLTKDTQRTKIQLNRHIGTLTFTAITLLGSRIPIFCQDEIPAACILVKKTSDKNYVLSGWHSLKNQWWTQYINNNQSQNYDHRSRKQDENTITSLSSPVKHCRYGWFGTKWWPIDSSKWVWMKKQLIGIQILTLRRPQWDCTRGIPVSWSRDILGDNKQEYVNRGQN